MTFHQKTYDIGCVLIFVLETRCLRHRELTAGEGWSRFKLRQVQAFHLYIQKHTEGRASVPKEQDHHSPGPRWAPSILGIQLPPREARPRGSLCADIIYHFSVWVLHAGGQSSLVLFIFFNKIKGLGNSLAIQWLGLMLSLPGTQVQSLVGELISYRPCNTTTDINK